MNETQLFLIRHGETMWNVERRCQGHTDIPLNEKGLAQAEKLGEFMHDVALHAVYASDLSRAAQTAEKVARQHGLQVQKCRGLRERSYGEWEGLSLEQIAEHYPNHMEARRQGGMYGVEKFAGLQQRVVHALTELAQKHLGENILAVSHGGSINAFLHWITNGQLGTGVTVIENTSVTRLTFDETEAWEVVDLNETRHLEGVEL